jgi:hypothetical protein
MEGTRTKCGEGAVYAAGYLICFGGAAREASGGEALLDRVLDCGKRRRRHKSLVFLPSVVRRRPAVVKAPVVKDKNEICTKCIQIENHI